MTQRDRFPEGVCEKLGHYVYRLIDPRNGETFYVGKGQGNRVFDHADGVKIEDEKEVERLHPKFDRIRAIKNAGLDVLHVIHRHEIPKDAIFEVEAALIDAYPGLTNIQGGHASSDRGPMNHIELIDKYNLPEFPLQPRHRLIFININKLNDRICRQKIYDQTRYRWRLSKSRAEKAEFALSVVRGVVVGAFGQLEWFPATTEYFPDIPNADNSQPHRFGFRGKAAPPDIWSLYVGERGKRITQDALKHDQNPIRYYDPEPAF